MLIHKLALIIFILNIFLRISIFTYPLFVEDGYRDVLVARHILHYQERPKMGPHNSLLGRANSPLYYYLIAAVLGIKDNVTFLGIFTIFLQSVSAVAIYYMGRLAFGQIAGFGSALLYTLSFVSFGQVNTLVWQAWVMQPFLYLSLIFFIRAHQRHRLVLLCWGVLLFHFAGALNHAPYALLPLILPVSFYLLYKLAWSLKTVTGLVALWVLPGLFLYVPLFALNLGLPTVPQINHSFVQSFFICLQLLFQIFFNNSFLCLMAGVGIVVAFWLARSWKYLLLWLGLLLPVAFVAAISLPVTSLTFYGVGRYLVPAYPFIILLLAGSIKRLTGQLSLMVWVPLLIFVYLTNPWQQSIRLDRFRQNVTLTALPNPIIESIALSLQHIKDSQDIPNYNFFKVVTYKEGVQYPWLEGTFYSQLETRLNTQLVRLSDTDNRSFVPLGQDEYSVSVYERQGQFTWSLSQLTPSTR